MRTPARWLCASFSVFVPFLAAAATGQEAAADPVVARILELGRGDNRVMEWADVATNRFGGRLTGSDAYANATRWAVWQFGRWGIHAELDLVGELPVGFNRGPWSGRMIAPNARPLYFGTPSFTAGTKGVQRGRVARLLADPFSIPGRNPSAEDLAKKRAAVAAAVTEVQADPAAFAGAWVLIGGESIGFARDGRRGTPEYPDSALMPPLTNALVAAGALGTIQRSADPISILDGHVESWERLPVLPDIKLVDRDYDEIKTLLAAGTKVELEFEIRNWFKPGPVPYHNVVAVIPGTVQRDEWVVLGAHFDSFDGGTGAVDNGSGFSPAMEAMRLIRLAGGAPRRTIALILFAAEENGLVGSLAWLQNHPERHQGITVMINRDGSPGAITGVTVPQAWHAPFQRITAPLLQLEPRWPFALTANEYPEPRPTQIGGTDSVSFAMRGIPTLRVRNESDYPYRRAWHTLYDTYGELVPYADHQKHTALVTAVLAWGAANHGPLPRDGVYLPDGLFVDLTLASGARVMAELAYRDAPLWVAQFVRLVEQAGVAGRIVAAANGIVRGEIDAGEGLKAGEELPLAPDPAVRHGAGALVLSGPNSFSLIAGTPPEGAAGKAIGRVIAGGKTLANVVAGDPIKRIRILRSGAEASAFATDDAAYEALRRAARRER